jgi:hypothetical protein
MEINTLGPSVTYGRTGRICIIGKIEWASLEEGDWTTVAFLVTDIDADDGCLLKKSLSTIPGVKNIIITRPPLGKYMAVIECEVEGYIRNYEGIAKSIRTKICRAADNSKNEVPPQ